MRVRIFNSAALLLSVACGIVMPAAWAPVGWWWLALAGYGTLFLLVLRARNALQSSVLGLGFGISMHLVAHGWALTALRTKIGMAMLPAACSTALFAAYLALYTALPCALWRALMSSGSVLFGGSRTKPPYAAYWLPGLASAGSFASLLTLGEWLRSQLFNGFSSLSLGYAFTDTWLSGYAPVFGVYGMSWAGYWITGLVGWIIFGYAGYFLSAALAIGTVCLGLALQRIDWVSQAGHTLGFRLIQSNVAQERKFDPAYAIGYRQQLISTIESRPADLIITAETAFTEYLNDLPADVLTRLQQFSAGTRSHLFLGIPTTAATGQRHNSVAHLAPDTKEIALYHKVRLMPFGEYTPFGFGWFTTALPIPLKDLDAGSNDQPPLIVGDQRIGTLICHEDLTGEQVRRWLPQATVIINPSNLAWFEASAAISQRLQIVRIRALESGRPVLRSTNTGITAHIDHKGNVVESLPESETATLSGKVQPMQGLTPYIRWGDWPVLMLSVTMLPLCFRACINRRQPLPDPARRFKKKTSISQISI
jgi:apolipoprotein N-acyltransferase